MLALSRVMAYVLIALGVAILVETAWIGGGQVGYLSGAVFIVLGVLRVRASR
jgi:hypothetical protein